MSSNLSVGRSVVWGLVFSVGVLALAVGCTKKTEASKERVVSVAIWNNYLSPEAQARFTKETGIKIQISNYASNEELLAKVQAGATGIDVAVPSDYMVEIMTKQGLLSALDSAKIPNKAGLDPKLLGQEYDPQNKFSIPYAWSSAGIAVNREIFRGEIKGWKDLFLNKELAGKFSLLDDAREVIAAALKMNGYSVNTTDAAALAKAKATLKEVRSRVKMFRSDMVDALVNKEVAVAHAYSVDALQAASKTGGKIEFILPEEGGTRAIDNLVILKTAKHIEEAHALINFLLSAEVNASFVNVIKGGPVVLKAKELLPAEVKANTALFPPDAVLSKFERIKDVGAESTAFDRLWTEIKSE
jgi:spermidine/putrescine transport system substrate-binding protein